jgi:hypothetical protein
LEAYLLIGSRLAHFVNLVRRAAMSAFSAFIACVAIPLIGAIDLY